MKNIFAENLKAARKQKGWSQTIAAEKIRIKRPTYAAYEEGRSAPKQNTLLRICRIFEIEDLKSFLAG